MPIVEPRSSDRHQACKLPAVDRFFIDSDDEDDSNVLSVASNIRKNSSYTKEFDPVTFCVTKVDPKDFANQLTLLDLPVFKAIQPEELTSCAWNSKEKLTLTPNIVAFTRRFNQVCLWCQKEILNRDNVKIRSEILAHFIKIAKKLLQLNNLHSAFAIISGLQSNAIYPLSKTWAELSNKEKSAFDKMAKLFSDENNFDRIRRYMSNVKLPCIPYLGLYLTDLIYIDVAHPSSGGLETTQRSLLMNNILRVLSEFQNSVYENIVLLENLQNYLKSVRYIDELQKFVEEDLYNKSLELEPRMPPRDASDSLIMKTLSLNLNTGSLDCKDRKSSLRKEAPIGMFLVQQKLKAQSLTPQVNKFKMGHRKTLSLGANLPKNICRYNNESFTGGNDTLPTVLDSRRHLLDDSLLDSMALSVTGISSTLSSSHAPDNVHDNAEDSGNESDRKGLLKRKIDKRQTQDAVECTAALLNSPESLEESCVKPKNRSRSAISGSSSADCPAFILEGSVRKKTVMRNGVKRSALFPVYTRYWLKLKSSCHVSFYAVKKLAIRKLQSRVSYRNKPTESIHLANWMILENDGPFHKDTFYMQEPTKGIVYKIRVGSEQKAREWVTSLKLLIKNYHASSKPSNLMTFD